MWFRKVGTMWIKEKLFPPPGTFWVTPEEVQDVGGITYQRVKFRTKRFSFEAFTADETEIYGHEDPACDGHVLSARFLQRCTPDELALLLPDATFSPAVILWEPLCGFLYTRKELNHGALYGCVSTSLPQFRLWWSQRSRCCDDGRTTTNIQQI